MHFAPRTRMCAEAIRNDCRYDERATHHRHSRPHSAARRTPPRRVVIELARYVTDGGPRRVPARRTQRGSVRTAVSTGAGRSASADPDRGAAERSDATERSRCGDHHGQAPSRSRADVVIAAREHYPHRHSPRKPFLELLPELHSRTVRMLRTRRTPRYHEGYRGVRRGRAV